MQTPRQDKRPRPWQASYPTGTNIEIAEVPWASIPAMVEDSVRNFGAGKAFTQCMPNGMNGVLTFNETARLSDGFAVALRETARLSPGDRVAIQLPNCLAYPVAAIGTLKAGCTIVNTNPLYTASEMNFQFRNSGAKALVIIDMFADRLEEALKGTDIRQVWLVRISDWFPGVVAGIIRLVQKYWNKQIPVVPKLEVPIGRFRDVVESGTHQRIEVKKYWESIGLSDVAVLQYTGGTTGVSKGAALTHGNLLSNLMQVAEVLQGQVRKGKEVILTALPLYHIFAYTANLLFFFRSGAHNVLIPSPRPLANLKRAFENYPITWMSGVNTLYNGLCNETWFTDHPPKQLVACIAGGMAMHKAVADRWKKITGIDIIEGYGLTEASPVICFNPLGGRIKLETIGIPVPSTDVKLIDESGKEVERGTPGELCARGPQIMRGYWEAQSETLKVLQDGWLHTGDVAVMDQDGYFQIVDRIKDMIKVSGFNVFPNEVEDCIARHPDVVEVAVIGVPDDASGEAVKAFVVVRRPAGEVATPETLAGKLTAEIVREHCHKYLTRYKTPKFVEFRADLPKSPIGKILRKELRKK